MSRVEVRGGRERLSLFVTFAVMSVLLIRTYSRQGAEQSKNISLHALILCLRCTKRNRIHKSG